jgi:restriction system protein
MAVWGIHMGAHVGARPIEEGYVAIGWPEMGDPRQYPDRNALILALARLYPQTPVGARPGNAGVLYRFTREIQIGDFIVYPSTHVDRMVNIGRFSGEAEFVPDTPDGYPNRRGVQWLGHFPRNEFTQNALHEIGSAITLFSVRRHVSEFLQMAGVADAVALAQAPQANDADALILEEAPDDVAAAGEVAQQAEISTSDFIIRKIMDQMSGYEFEELVANLLECMGYSARITARSGDGGVDIIAHRDKLGFEPPIVKVQCKRKTSPVPRPEVDQLLGTLGEGEFGLFISLGSFGRQCQELERNRPKLRLIGAEQFVALLLENYNRLAPHYRTLIPLKQIYVPDLKS